MVQKDEGCLKLGCVCCSVFTVSFSIWCGIYFGIYYNFLKPFTESECTVLSDETFYSGWDLSLYKYRQLYLQLTIEGSEYLGFGCESDANRLGVVTSDSQSGSMPYNYYDAYSWNGNTTRTFKTQQEVQPRWFCDSWDTAHELGQTYKCWYAVSRSWSTVDDASLTQDYPKVDAEYLEVIFQSEAHYDETQYLVLMILCLGVFSGGPCAIILFCSIPLGFKLHDREGCTEFSTLIAKVIAITLVIVTFPIWMPLFLCYKCFRTKENIVAVCSCLVKTIGILLIIVTFPVWLPIYLVYMCFRTRENAIACAKAIGKVCLFVLAIVTCPIWSIAVLLYKCLHRKENIIAVCICLGRVLLFILAAATCVVWVPAFILYKICRKHVCVCWEYYDYSIRVENRLVLAKHALSTSNSLQLHSKLRKQILEYIPSR